MSELWRNLVPLALASAVVPAPLVVTILLLRSSARTAAAWVAGMTVVRLAQGAAFALIFAGESAATDTAAERSAILYGILLVVSFLLFVTAAQKLFSGDDPDAPPPKWMAKIATMGAGRAFLFGAALLLANAKFWVFTLGAISAIEEARLGRGASVATFLAFVVLVVAPQLVALGLAVVAPARARSLLNGVADWLQRNNRAIVVVVSLVFGTWFLLKALAGFGVI
jgi:Sap, sulfolipid-1-addressing protein